MRLREGKSVPGREKVRKVWTRTMVLKHLWDLGITQESAKMQMPRPISQECQLVGISGSPGNLDADILDRSGVLMGGRQSEELWHLLSQVCTHRNVRSADHPRDYGIKQSDSLGERKLMDVLNTQGGWKVLKKIFFLRIVVFYNCSHSFLGACMMNENRVFRYIAGMWNYVFNAIILLLLNLYFKVADSCKNLGPRIWTLRSAYQNPDVPNSDMFHVCL